MLKENVYFKKFDFSLHMTDVFKFNQCYFFFYSMERYTMVHYYMTSFYTSQNEKTF